MKAGWSQSHTFVSYTLNTFHYVSYTLNTFHYVSYTLNTFHYVSYTLNTFHYVSYTLNTFHYVSYTLNSFHYVSYTLNTFHYVSCTQTGHQIYDAILHKSGILIFLVMILLFFYTEQRQVGIFCGVAYREIRTVWRRRQRSHELGSPHVEYEWSPTFQSSAAAPWP